MNTRTITAITPQKGSRERRNIFLDGVYAFSLDPMVVEKCGLFPGKEIAEGEAADLVSKDEAEKAYQSALRLLGFRQRSKKEVQDRLIRRGFGLDIVTGVMERLESQGLIDDRDFVAFWKENSEDFHPKGKRLMALELRRAGVEPPVIREGLKDVDEPAGAYKAARKKARSLEGLDYDSFRTKLGGFLGRRGYGWDIVKEVVEHVWREKNPDSRDESG